MRILHTADWHIGQTLAGHDRGHEHRAVLDRLAAIAAAQEADALIVAGDVFDHQNPSGEAQRIFYEAILALKRARPGMTIVLTAGNHDSAGRLEAPQAILAPLDVRIVGNVRRKAGRIDTTRHVVPLRRANGGRAGALVLAVSHPTAACLPPLSMNGPADGPSPVVAATRALYAELATAARAAADGAPLIVTGHLHVSGASQSEGAERRILVGGQHAVPPDIFPDDAAYVALGHLHKPQSIGRPTMRYSGSLLPLSASELGYQHGVTLITLESGAAAVEHVPIPRPVPFLRIPATGEIALGELGDRLAALSIPSDLPVEQRPFVQVWIARNEHASALRAEIERVAEAFPVRLVEPRVAPLPSAPGAADAAILQEPLATLDPEVLFRRAFETVHGRPPGSTHLTAFHEAAAAAGG